MEREIFHGMNEAGGTTASLCVDVGEDGLLLTSRDYIDEVQVYLSRRDEDRLRQLLVERSNQAGEA